MTQCQSPAWGGPRAGPCPESGHAQFASASAQRALWAEQGADALTLMCRKKHWSCIKRSEISGMYTNYTARAGELALLRSLSNDRLAAVRAFRGLDHRLENAVTPGRQPAPAAGRADHCVTPARCAVLP